MMPSSNFHFRVHLHSPSECSAHFPCALQHMLAGATAGMAEHTAMYPVDTIKTRMQALAHPGQQVRHCQHARKTSRAHFLWQHVVPFLVCSWHGPNGGLTCPPSARSYEARPSAVLCQQSCGERGGGACMPVCVRSCSGQGACDCTQRNAMRAESLLCICLVST